jgi:two-component system sensor histidine kinase CpxA
MYRLFWKIFAWFWLATIVIVAVTAWSTGQIYKSFETSPFRDWVRTQEEVRATSAVAVLETRGREGLRAWVEASGRSPWRRTFFLLDAAGEDVLGRGLPPAVDEISRRVAAGESPERAPSGTDGLIITRVSATDGAPYYLVSEVGWRGGAGRRRPPPEPGETRPAPGGARDLVPRLGWRIDRHPEFTGIRIAIALVLSGVVCLWLAWYLTRPMRHLRAATARIAAGNFDVRVSAALGRRRDEIADLGRDFDDMAQRLKALLESHRQLLVDISHELRSPLARLQIALGLARQRGGGAIDAELDRIERECEALNELIAQLLSLSRLESDGRTGDFIPVDLQEIVEGVVADARYEALERGREVRLSHADQVSVSGNVDLLRSAVENVVRNAVRHTPERTTVEVAVARSGSAGEVSVSVRDYGPGVPDAMLGRLFEPFVRVEPARERGRGGFGLGLSIARRAVVVHGGRISARNAPGGGLVVEIVLPIREPA